MDTFTDSSDVVGAHVSPLEPERDRLAEHARVGLREGVGVHLARQDAQPAHQMPLTIGVRVLGPLSGSPRIQVTSPARLFEWFHLLEPCRLAGHTLFRWGEKCSPVFMVAGVAIGAKWCAVRAVLDAD